MSSPPTAPLSTPLLSITPLHAYLFADPAAHSLSPQMHRAAFAWAGIEADYRAVQVPAAQLSEQITALRQADRLGANLSLPHKETVLPLLDGISPAAQSIGAVNTVVNRQGHLFGENTDAPGLLAALQDAGFAEPVGGRGQAVVVLGAGGAARAAVYTALISLKRDVYIVNRTRPKAEELAGRWAQAGAGSEVRAADIDEVPWERAGLIINASSAGLGQPDQTPLPGFDFGRCAQAALYDMVYKPLDTRLMHEARAAGLHTENGLGMLAHQARLAFMAWTGVDVPITVFRAALRGHGSGATLGEG